VAAESARQWCAVLMAVVTAAETVAAAATALTAATATAARAVAAVWRLRRRCSRSVDVGCNDVESRDAARKSSNATA
jgi:hypothetical protein